jgi:glycosyltransferase involved in cell wall biosynthesis
MKILQVIPRFNPKHGGGLNVAVNLSRHMVKRGHQVTLLTTDWDIDLEYLEKVRKDGVEVIPFNAYANLCLFIPSPAMSKWLDKNIKNYDVIHLNGARSYQNNIIRKYARKNNVPYVMQAHGSIMRIVERKQIKQLYDWVWGYKVYKDASKFIALSQSEVESHKKMGINERDVAILPNGIDLDDYKDLPPRGEFRKKHGIKDSEKVVLYLGRLHKSKDIELLVDSFSSLSKKVPDARLLLVGPDERHKQEIVNCIERFGIQEKSLFTGAVFGRDKLRAFIDADVFVTPTFYGFPITFAEACACGIPIVTTSKGDVLEWIDGNAGYVTEPSGDAVFHAVLKILSDESVAKKFSDNARSMAYERFNWEKIVRELDILYENVAKSRGVV